ncbi:unnamed protein product [Allacma fusca]|uniref:Uncharacterized protein n=1 Tax=Allacma fusca TaxID=39272 RepID=A0A8J2KNP1_9HEXA|nr:unnamed protein product [Allacma fusca]
MIVNAFTRFFIADIYKGTQNAMTLKEYITRKNSNLTTPDVFDEQNLYILLKVIGFAIMMYCMYGARCFIIQFTFFCRVLRNASFIWNERFRNHLMKENPNPDDQTRVRLDMMLLTQDHLILVQLFKMTESLFCVALQWFYAFQVITVTLAMYGFALITGVMSCQKFWGLVEDHNCSETSDRLNDWGNNVELYSFERPNVDPSIRKVGDSLTYLLIFVQSFTTLFIITHAGAAAHEEAMRGWQILRRNSFMTAANVFDRNFVHSLIISFARNNPMQISAGGYFVVNKRLLIEIILATMVYFITLLQFRPGQINMTAMCNGKALDSSLIGDDT